MVTIMQNALKTLPYGSSAKVSVAALLFLNCPSQSPLRCLTLDTMNQPLLNFMKNKKLHPTGKDTGKCIK